LLEQGVCDEHSDTRPSPASGSERVAHFPREAGTPVDPRKLEFRPAGKLMSSVMLPVTLVAVWLALMTFSIVRMVGFQIFRSAARAPACYVAPHNSKCYMLGQ